jgi:hypothetical protein
MICRHLQLVLRLAAKHVDGGKRSAMKRNLSVYSAHLPLLYTTVLIIWKAIAAPTVALNVKVTLSELYGHRRTRRKVENSHWP